MSMTIDQILQRNKNLGTIHVKTFCEGLEVKDSPVHYLDGNDVLLDYICYLSLRQWRREQIPKDQLPYLPCAPGDLD